MKPISEFGDKSYNFSSEEADVVVEMFGSLKTAVDASVELSRILWRIAMDIPQESTHEANGGGWGDFVVAPKREFDSRIEGF
jgi:hypothetical protein